MRVAHVVDSGAHTSGRDRGHKLDRETTLLTGLLEPSVGDELCLNQVCERRGLCWNQVCERQQGCALEKSNVCDA